MLFKIAWRNIWRNKIRSLVIVSAVAIGVCAGIFLMAFYNGMLEERIRTAIETEISHIQIHHPEFLSDFEIGYYLSNGPEMLDHISAEPYVKATAGRVIISGMISTASGSTGIQINGIDPKRENKVTQLNNKIIRGRYFSDTLPMEIIVSEKVLRMLKLTLGRKVILTFQDKDGNLASGAFRTVGVYKTINTPYDETNVFVNIRDIDTLAGITNQFNEIAILLVSGSATTDFKRQLQEKYPADEVKSWTEISPEMNLLVSSSDIAMMIYMGIILLALTFGIVNTMQMAVLERKMELGMLMALGMNKTRVFGMIIFETIFLVLTGVPAGVLAGVSITMYANHIGINLMQYSQAYSSFGFSSIVYPSLDVNNLFVMLTMVAFTAFIASLFPARRALRLKPAECIRR
jgi:ABC-type lipoprotein release transport system permease subunit